MQRSENGFESLAKLRNLLKPLLLTQLASQEPQSLLLNRASEEFEWRNCRVSPDFIERQQTQF